MTWVQVPTKDIWVSRKNIQAHSWALCPAQTRMSLLASFLTGYLGRLTILHRVITRYHLSSPLEWQPGAVTVSHLPVLPTITESKRTTSSSIIAHTTPCETLHNLLQHSSPPSLSFTIRLGERQSRQENNALKFTESPKVTFSGSGKEPSVLIPSLGFLPELSDAQVKANKAPRPLPCFVTF